MAKVTTFRDRSLVEVEFPYVFLDACFCKARVGGDRRGCDVGDSQSGAFGPRSCAR